MADEENVHENILKEDCQEREENRIIQVDEIIEEKSERRKELETWLNKIMKVEISDGRTLIGLFLCTDRDRNIILGSCQEYVGVPGVDKEEPRILGLAMVPGKHVASVEIDQYEPGPPVGIPFT